MMYKTTSIDVFIYCWWITFFDKNPVTGIRLYVIYLMATSTSNEPPFESENYVFTAQIALPNNGFFYWRLVVLFIKYKPINHITRFSIPVSNLIGTVKCIEVVYYA